MFLSYMFILCLYFFLRYFYRFAYNVNFNFWFKNAVIPNCILYNLYQGCSGPRILWSCAVPCHVKRRLLQVRSASRDMGRRGVVGSRATMICTILYIDTNYVMTIAVKSTCSKSAIAFKSHKIINIQNRLLIR